MIEYFCTNCGATLNEQFGFDPNKGVWKCIVCNQLLTDDDVYEGTLYEGIAWFCDCCGALLNKQSGFSDIYGSWTCTNCYHCNPINEDEIYKSEEDYIKSKNSEPEDIIECPHCGSNLREQFLFSEYDDEWICAECYTSLKRDSSNDEFVVDQKDTSDDFSDSFSSTFSSNRFFENYCYEKKHTPFISDKEIYKRRIKATIFNRKKIMIDTDSVDLIGLNYRDVYTSLRNHAFSKIKLIPIEDIYVNSSKKHGEVEQVVIAGTSFFEKGDTFSFDAEIFVTYHIKRKIVLPFSERDLKKFDVTTAGDKLQDLGFTEIYERPIRDLITGVIKKDGTIEKITIGTVSSFKKYTVFDYDEKIVIEYHTFKKKNSH